MCSEGLYKLLRNRYVIGCFYPVSILICAGRRTQRGAASDSTRYATYLDVYDSIMAARKARLDEISMQLFYRPYNSGDPISERRRVQAEADLLFVELSAGEPPM